MWHTCSRAPVVVAKRARIPKSLQNWGGPLNFVCDEAGLGLRNERCSIGVMLANEECEPYNACPTNEFLLNQFFKNHLCTCTSIMIRQDRDECTQMGKATGRKGDREGREGWTPGRKEGQRTDGCSGLSHAHGCQLSRLHLAKDLWVIRDCNLQ